MSLVFDTLKLSKTLGRAFTPEQVEVLTEALTIDVTESLATKADLAVMKAELRTDIAALDTKMTGEIAALDTKFTGEISKVRSEIAALDTKFTGEFGKVRSEIAELETRMTAKFAAVETTIANTRAELIRWIVTTFAANIVTMITIAIAVAKIVAQK